MGARRSQKRADADKRIEKALNELAGGQFQSVRAAARANNVPHSTLLRRMDGGKSIAESREHQQILTIPEENALAECITRLAILGHPPKHAFIRELAEEIRANRDNSNVQVSIGDSWVQRFIHRHPELETACSHAIEAARIRDVTKKDLERWFDEFEKTIQEKNIHIDDMYNMDETGFAIGVVQRSYVVVNKDLKTRYQAQPGRQEWASVVECVCANGKSIKPFIILKGEKVMSSWIPKSALDLEWHFGASQKGWTSNELGFNWLVRVFDPTTRQNRTRLLICDGHDSHISAKFVAHCIENDICLFLLLPHSSHLLQPLDVGVFSPLKAAVSAELDRLIRVGVNRLEKVEWVESYIRARPNAFTEKNIRAGWRHSGLAPTNRLKHALLRPGALTAETDTSSSITPEPPAIPTFEDIIRNSPELDAATLDVLNSKLSELAIRNEINTPIRRELPKVLSRNRQLLAENAILKHRLGEIERIVCDRKERKQGKRNVLKGKTVVSTLEVLEELKKCEMQANLKKTNRGPSGRRNQAKVIQEVESTSEEDAEDADIDALDVIEVARFRR